MPTDLHCKSRYISSSSIWMWMSQSLGMIYERVKIIIRNPWPVSHTLTHSLPWASSFNFSISYEYLFIDSQLTNEEVKLFRYLYAHPHLYLVSQNFSQCWMNCLAVWLEHFNNSENSFHFTGYFRRLWCTGFRQRHPELSCPGILLQSKTWCVSKDIMCSLPVNLNEL